MTARSTRWDGSPPDRIELGPGDRLDVEPGTYHSATVGPAGVECMEASS